MGVSAKVSPLRRKLRSKVVDTILDAAEEVALEAGIGGITIAAVAERAGVAVGTLYNYFPNGDGIIAALFRTRREQLLPLIKAAFKATEKMPFERRLREFVRRLLVAFEDYSRFLRIAVLVDRVGSKCKPRDTALMDAIVHAFEAIMREGARSKQFQASRAPIYARMLHGAFRSMFLWRLDEGAPLGGDGDLLVDTFLYGITAFER